MKRPRKQIGQSTGDSANTPRGCAADPGGAKTASPSGVAPPEDEMISAAGSDCAGRRAELLRCESARACGLVQVRGVPGPAHPMTREGMDVNFDDTPGSGVTPEKYCQTRVAWRLVTFKDKESYATCLCRGRLDRRDQFEIVLEMVGGQHEYIQHASDEAARRSPCARSSARLPRLKGAPEGGKGRARLRLSLGIPMLSPARDVCVGRGNSGASS